MRNLARIIALALVLTLAPVAAMAAPMYYTFEGTVSSLWDSGNLAAQSNVSLGDKVSYTFVIDTDRRGQVTSSGNTYNLGNNVFYSGLYSGALQGGEAGPNDLINSYGYSSGGWKKVRTQLYAGNSLSNVYFEDSYYGFENGIEGWQIGDSFASLYENSYNDFGQLSQVRLSGVTLTRVSSAAPTPIPGAIWLLGAGLGALGVVRRRGRRG